MIESLYREKLITTVSNYYTMDHAVQARSELVERRWTKSDYWNLLYNVEYKQILPDRQMDRQLKKLLIPFPRTKRDNRIHLSFSDCIDDENGTQFSFSALTSEMEQLDRLFFQRMIDRGDLQDEDRPVFSYLDLLYKPYFYGLRIHLDKESIRTSDLLKYCDERRYMARFSYASLGNQDELSDNRFYGTLTYIGSPKQERTGIVTFDAVDQPATGSIPSGNPINDIKEVRKLLGSVFNGVSSATVNTRRVGQANCIELSINSGSRTVMIDVGSPFNGKQPSGTELGAIERIKPDLVILTHWHSDHFSLAYKWNRDRFFIDDLKNNYKSISWIAPEYHYNDTNAKRLIELLTGNNRLYIIDSTLDGKRIFRSKDHHYALFKGKGVIEVANVDAAAQRHTRPDKSEASQVMHASGLLLETNKALLPGDCLYDYWPEKYGRTDRKNKIEYLVVPHHGCDPVPEELKVAHKIDTQVHKDKKAAKLKAVFSANEKRAVYCVGENNSYKHPTPAADSFLESIDPDHPFDHIDTWRESDDTKLKFKDI